MFNSVIDRKELIVVTIDFRKYINIFRITKICKDILKGISEYSTNTAMYLTIIPRACVGYEMADSQRGV